MNIIKSLTARIEEYRATNKNPCKNYATEAAAEKAVAAVAAMAGRHFYKYPNKDDARPARYVVFYVESWGRWVGCVDLTELLARPTSTGGYLGICGDFYTF